MNRRIVGSASVALLAFGSGGTFREVSMYRHILMVLGLLVTTMAPREASTKAVHAPQTYWLVSYYEIDWPKVDSLTKLFKAYTLPTADEAKKQGVLLDYRIFIHSYAGRENVVIMQRFNSFGAIQADTSVNAAFRRLVPDASKRKTILDAFNSSFGGGLHRDEIYTEVTRQ